MRHRLIITLFVAITGKLFVGVLQPAVAASDDVSAVSIMSPADLAAFPNPVPDERLHYGADPLQFVDLRLPLGPGPHPVMVLIHGGCWLSEFDITHIGKLAAAFTAHGIATWTVEYRRVGDAGGGWPGTFEDIAAAADFLPGVADQYNLDTARVIVVGHSAGGHLALWLAARNRFTAGQPFYGKNPVELKGVLALAPAPDLAWLHKEMVCGHVIDKLMGGSPLQYPERYAVASMMALTPVALPQWLVIGKFDADWAMVGERYFNAATAAGDNVRLIEAKHSGHFEMIDPDSTTWPLVAGAAMELLGIPQ